MHKVSRTFLRHHLSYRGINLNGLAVALLLGLGASGSALADASPQPLPFAQDWSSNALTSADDWSGVPGVEGFLGQDITTAVGANPQSLTGTSSAANDIDVVANQSNPSALAAGGVAEFDGIQDACVALNGSAAADAPNLMIHLDTTGKTQIKVDYTLRDLDGSNDNSVQPVALQYRVGSSGPFINVPDAFVADATTGPGLAVQTTGVSATLPGAVDNQPLVKLRIITANATGNDEWVGVDDIEVYGNTLPTQEPTLTTDFLAHVISVDDPSGALQGDVAVGQTVAGAYTYVTNLPDLESSPQNGYFRPQRHQAATKINIGSHVFESDATGPAWEYGWDYTIFTSHDGSLAIESGDNKPLSDGASVERITIQYGSGAFPTGDALPSTLPDLETGLPEMVFIEGYSTLGQRYSLALSTFAVGADGPARSDGLIVSPASGSFVSQQQFDGALILPAGMTPVSMQAYRLGKKLPFSMPGHCWFNPGYGEEPGFVFCPGADELLSDPYSSEITWQIKLEDGTTLSKSVNWKMLR